jgi:hypothetical protein
MPQQVTANPKSVPVWMLPGLLAPQQGNYRFLLLHQAQMMAAHKVPA